MFNLTQQERTVLLFLAAVILVGSLLEIVSKRNAGFCHFLKFTDENYPSSKPDIHKIRKTQK